MWIAIVVELIIIGLIGGYWDEKIDNNWKNRRKYRISCGITYLVTSILSVFLIRYIGEIVFLYTIVSVLLTINEFLKAVNPIWGEAFSNIMMFSFWMAIILFFFSEKRVVVILVVILEILAIVNYIKEANSKIRQGIDLDAVERRKKFWNKIKLAKTLFKLWF